MIDLLNDTIPVENPYDSLSVCYQLGYFQGDSLLHAEVCHSTHGFHATPLSFQLWNDNWIMLLILVAFILFVLLLKWNMMSFNKQIMDFFFPSREVKNSKPDDERENSFSRMLSLLLLSLLGSIGTFTFMQLQTDALLNHLLPSVITIAVYLAAWVSYFIIKRLSYSFVNWIFFNKKDCAIWFSGQTFLFTMEALSLFFISIISVYTTLSLQDSLWITLAIIVVSKILLLYKTLVIFFPKSYGGLHLFVYFCTLEVMPLAVFLKLLTDVSIGTLVKL